MRMKNKCCSWQPIVLGCLFVWWLCLSEARINYIMERRAIISLLLLVGMSLAFIYQVVIQQKRDFTTFAGWILMSAFVLRAIFVLVAPYNLCSHDMGTFIDLDNQSYTYGHLGYIEYLYCYHKLFDFDPRTFWSFYNPPGFHILGAVVLEITHKILGVAQPLCYESIQVITLFFSSMTVWIIFRIMQEFPFQKKYILLATGFIAYFPFFTIFAASLNNDIQAIFCMVLAIWYTIRWYRKPSLKNILVISLAIGVGMFTKINTALVSFGIAYIFAVVFWRNPKERKKYMLQFLAFLALCMPIGLFIPMRNLIKFGVPLLYVQEIPTNNNLYLGHPGIISRLGFVLDRQLSYAFAKMNAKVEINIWIQTIRTALFDEFRPDAAGSFTDGLGLILLWGNLILAIVLNYAYIKNLAKHKREGKCVVMERELTIAFCIMYGIMIFSYIKYCFDQPFVCTMNFRYIAPALIFPILGGLTMCQTTWKGSHKECNQRTSYFNLFIAFIGILITVSLIFNLQMISLV